MVRIETDSEVVIREKTGMYTEIFHWYSDSSNIKFWIVIIVGGIFSFLMLYYMWDIAKIIYRKIRRLGQLKQIMFLLICFCLEATDVYFYFKRSKDIERYIRFDTIEITMVILWIKTMISLFLVMINISGISGFMDISFEKNVMRNVVQPIKRKIRSNSGGNITIH